MFLLKNNTRQVRGIPPLFIVLEARLNIQVLPCPINKISTVDLERRIKSELFVRNLIIPTVFTIIRSPYHGSASILFLGNLRRLNRTEKEKPSRWPLLISELS